MAAETRTPLYGLMAEFETGHSLLVAADRARQDGYRIMDAYSPVPVEGLDDALGLRRSWVPLIVLCGGLTGVTFGFLLPYWTMVLAYPINIGGRPLNSWPQWVPIMFECTILFSAFAAFFGMWALNGLPQPYHPVFNVPGFERSNEDRYFLAIEARDPRFDPVATRSFLESMGAYAVSDIPS